MKIVKPGFKIESRINGEAILKKIERFGRTCYKSEARTTPDSARKFCAMLIKNGHESVLEHVSVTVRIICDRGVSHEIVRHRIGVAYSQESTRYCNYKSKGIKVIRPFFFESDDLRYQLWIDVMRACESGYVKLIESGATPQEARSVLPNSLKTEIVMTLNLRAWRHFLKQRCSEKAHSQMREIFVPLLAKFKELIPVIFEDIQAEYK